MNETVNLELEQSPGEGKIYTITDIANLVGKSPATIRHWEKEMDGVIKVNRSAQGARFYTEKDKLLFIEIDHWREQNFSLDNIAKFLKSMMQLQETGERDTSFNAPNNNSELLEQVGKIIEDQLSQHTKVLQLGDGVSEEDKRDAHISRESAKRKVEARLKSQALREWAKKPDGERLVKSGLFRKEENISERDAYVEDFIAEFFEEEYRKELMG